MTSFAADGRPGKTALDAVLGSGAPVVVLGGEQAPDAEQMELSTVATGIVAEAHVCMAYSKGSSKRDAWFSRARRQSRRRRRRHAVRPARYAWTPT